MEFLTATDERDVSIQQVFYGTVQEGKAIDRIACSLGLPALAWLLVVLLNENLEHYLCVWLSHFVSNQHNLTFKVIIISVITRLLFILPLACRMIHQS
jgi:hypothetical protein